MVEAVPIFVKIGLKIENGEVRHDYPDWTRLPLERNDKEDHRDHQIVKWIYDNCCGHNEEDECSPRGEWHGVMLVTKKFADQAVKTFPGRVTIINEEKLEDFWDNRCHAHTPEADYDLDELQGLKLEYELREILGEETETIKSRIATAIDENNSVLGKRKNHRKRWVDFKARNKIKIKG